MRLIHPRLLLIAYIYFFLGLCAVAEGLPSATGTPASPQPQPQPQAETRSTSSSEVTTECDYHPSRVLGRFVSYCVQKVIPHSAAASMTEQTRIPVAFYMHGLFQDHQSWFKDWSDEFVRAAEENNRAFAAVTFDTEPMSFFTDYRGYTSGPHAYETWFVTEFLHDVTRKHGLCDQRECRTLVGASMGGFGALKTAFKHPELFSAVAASSAALPAMDPYDDLEKWRAYFDTKPIGSVAGVSLLTAVRNIFKDREYFKQNNPIALVERFDAQDPRFPLLYFQCGGRDLYGFEDGFLLLQNALDARKIPYLSRFYPKEDHFIAGTPRTLLGYVIAGTKPSPRAPDGIDRWHSFRFSQRQH